jgi:hypothetical protein
MGLDFAFRIEDEGYLRRGDQPAFPARLGLIQ